MPAEDPTMGADANSSMPAPMPADNPDTEMDTQAAPDEQNPEMSTPESPDDDGSDEMPDDTGNDTGESDDTSEEPDSEDGENSITKKIDDLKTSLNPDHLEAWAKYGESMAAEESGEDEAEGGEEPENPMENPMTPQAGAGAAPMAESIIFTKRQMRRLNEEAKDDKEKPTYVVMVNGKKFTETKSYAEAFDIKEFKDKYFDDVKIVKKTKDEDKD